MKLSGSLFRAQCRAACRAARRVKLPAAAAPARDVLYAPQMSALWQIIIKEILYINKYFAFQIRL